MDANDANSSRSRTIMDPPQLDGQDEEEEKKEEPNALLKKSTSEMINNA